MNGTTNRENAMLSGLCREHTQLCDDDIAILEQLAVSLPYICNLTGSDVFIDCFRHDFSKCVVVAEARPGAGDSLYKESVVGKLVLPEKEPAVFRAIQTGLPVRDILGTTQENKIVWQVVIPIKNRSDEPIGVLIQEKDISAAISRDKKYDELTRIIERQREKLHRLQDPGTTFMPTVNDNRLVMKEIHHRVKNNLQLVGSMLNLQARQTDIPEIKAAFRENVARILSIATVYDVLSLDAKAVRDPGEKIMLLSILRNVCQNAMLCSNDGDRRIVINAGGENFDIDHDKATSIALVVNELVMNAVKYAFPGESDGTIHVSAKRGVQHSTVSIEDNGRGFAATRADSNSMGMNIVQSLVKEKLRGDLHIESDDSGSRINVTFTN